MSFKIRKETSGDEIQILQNRWCFLLTFFNFEIHFKFYKIISTIRNYFFNIRKEISNIRKILNFLHFGLPYS